ncbi:hypothetical protein EJ02DRAFT_454501, partial [Clathrospora elynae]
MPPGSFAVTLEARSKEAARLWEYIERLNRKIPSNRRHREHRTKKRHRPPDFDPDVRHNMATSSTAMVC